MGASLLGLALGLSDQAVIQGLAEFRGDEQDNPGRGNWFEHRGIHIVVDFAHNEHGLRALGDAIKTLKAKRVIVMLGQAGDRSDAAIRAMADAALSMQPDRMLIYELPGYERGRNIGEPPALIRAAALQAGMQAGRLVMHMNPLEAARDALAHARSGDVLVLLALIQRREILQKVHEFMQSN
jgi:UDP-N-acetylmuramyl tripeptide synthase